MPLLRSGCFHLLVDIRKSGTKRGETDYEKDSRYYYGNTSVCPGCNACDGGSEAGRIFDREDPDQVAAAS